MKDTIEFDELAETLYKAPFAILAHDTSDSPVYTYANKAAQDLFEGSWDEIVGKESRSSAEEQVPTLSYLGQNAQVFLPIFKSTPREFACRFRTEDRLFSRIRMQKAFTSQDVRKDEDVSIYNTSKWQQARMVLINTPARC